MSGVIQICLSVWVDMFCVCLVYGKSSVIGLCVVVSLLYAGVVQCVSLHTAGVVQCVSLHTTTPAYNNETTTHYTPHNNHTQPDHTRFAINQTNTEHIDPHR